MIFTAQESRAISDPTHPISDSAPPDVAMSPVSLGLQRYLLLLLSLTALCNFMDRQILAILLQSIKTELAVSDTAMGMLTGGAFALLYMVAGIPLARMADVGSRRLVIAGSLIVWSLLTICCGFVRNYTQLLIARMGVAVGEAGSMPATFSIIPDILPPERRGGAIGMIYFAGSFGVALSLWIGGILNEAIGWRMTMVVIGLPGLFLGMLFFLVSEPPRREAVARPLPLAKVVSGLRHYPSFIIALMLAGVASFVAYGMVGWAPTFLVRTLGLGTADVGRLMGIGMIFSALGSLFSGWLTDHLSRRHSSWQFGVGAVGLLAGLPCGLFFLDAEGEFTIGLSYALYQFFIVWWLPGVLTAVISLADPRGRGVATAILAIAQNLGGVALGPLMVGVLNDHWDVSYGAMAIRHSLTVVIWCVLPAAALGLAGMFTLRRDLMRVTEQPSTSISS